MPLNRIDELVGLVLDDRYRLLASIGAGASARVFLADDTRLRRRVAVKLLHESLADDALFLRRFEVEAQLVAGLNHPHILAVHDWGHDGVPYLVTEYLSGGSLRQLLDQEVRLSPSQALVVGLESARALDHAHRRGLVHRDIKPDNLLFDSDGRVRIADFGLARALAESSITEPSGAFLGSARYASPEQARGSTLDGRSDVYSLALVLAEAVTGSLPFESDTQIGTLMARTEVDFEPSEELGPLQRPLGRAGALVVDQRPDADNFAIALMATAEELPRPEPLPLAGAVDTVVDPDSDVDLTSIGMGSSLSDSGSNGPSRAVDPEARADPPAGIPDEGPTHTRREVKIVARREKQRLRTERLSAIERGEVHRRRWPWAIVALLMAAGAGVGGWFLWSNSQTEPIFAPNVVGAQVDELPGLLAGIDLTVSRPLEIRREQTVPGEVIAQDPSAGSEVEPGSELTVTVSLGEPLAVVPTDLVGLDIQAADLRLQTELLVVGNVEEVFNETAPPGQVLAVEAVLPELDRGSSVDLVISMGPAPRAVPDGLVEVTEQEARDLVEGARLVVVVTTEFSPSVADGIVIAATPASGTELEVGETVTLLVSLGREPVEVPDVEGLDIATAQRLLEEAGLVVSEIEGPPAEPVLTTDPPNGTALFRGDSVVIFTIGAGDEAQA